MNSGIKWIVLAIEGDAVHLVNGRFSEAQRAGIGFMVERAMRDKAVPLAAVVPPVVHGLTQREVAQDQGFTGDVCASCGGFEMRRAGTCLTCQSCGSTTGCS